MLEVFYYLNDVSRVRRYSFTRPEYGVRGHILPRRRVAVVRRLHRGLERGVVPAP